MRKPLLLLVASASVAGLAFTACGGGSSNSSATTAPSDSSFNSATKAATAAASATTAAAPTDVVALKQSPSSLDASDPVWSKAPATTVKTSVIQGSAATGPVDVKMQAAYSDTDVWFKFTWASAKKTTASNWVYDGTKWKAPSGQQDRLSLMWQLTPTSDFQAKGCLAVCHNPTTDTIDKWYMGSPAGTTTNNWQWTAGISNGMGQLNDLTLSSAAADPTNPGKGRFVADPNTGGGSTANTNATKDAPLKMQDPAKPPSMGPDYLLVSEAVALDVSKMAAGATVPNKILQPYTGDEGVIDAKGAWVNGQWTVVAHRKLDTGSPDDVKFVPGNSYPFGLAAWVALGDVDHTVTTEAYMLRLGK